MSDGSILERVAIASASAVVGAIATVVVWLIKRRLQRQPESEAIRLQRDRICHDEEYLALISKARSIGVAISPEDVDLKLLKIDQPTREELIAALKHTAFTSFSNTYALAITLERLLMDPAAIHESITVARREFLREFQELRESLPQVFDSAPAVRKKEILAYYHWIQDPSEANFEAWKYSLKLLQDAIDAGEIKIRGEVP